MKSQVKRFLCAARLYRPLNWTRTLLRDPQAAVNSLAAGLARRLGPPSPGNLSYRLIDRCFVAFPDWVRESRRLFRAATGLMNERAGEPAPAPHRTALVFLLKGPWILHSLHGYAVGCALRRSGYRVRFVVCTGSVERCGLAQERDRGAVPPYFCRACRQINGELNAEGFEVIDLNEYRDPEEEREVESIASLPRQEIAAHEVHGVRLLENMRPFLTRYYHGQYQKIDTPDDEVINHLKSGVRYLLRYRRLVGHLRPDCLCLFNGLFFPESLLFAVARGDRVPVLCVERGMAKNTLFLSANEPACHYRSDALWDHVKGEITAEHVARAEAHLADRRRRGPEDPCGVPRAIVDADGAKYRHLADVPHVVFFPPVSHDTASMGKEDPAGGILGTIDLLCRHAAAARKRLVIRSHPDEHHEHNPSAYPVRQYLADRNLLDGERVVCLDSREKWDPYRLAEGAEAVVVYNGTLGMELPALGHRVFNVARSHYAGKGFTIDLRTTDDFASIFRERKVAVSPGMKELALRYFYYFAFVANLPLDAFLDEHQPYSFRLLEGTDPSKGRAQLDGVAERVRFLLESVTGAPEPATT